MKVFSCQQPFFEENLGPKSRPAATGHTDFYTLIKGLEINRISSAKGMADCANTIRIYGGQQLQQDQRCSCG